MSLGNGWYADSQGAEYQYLATTAQYLMAQGVFWDPVTDQQFIQENGFYRSVSNDGYYLYDGTNYNLYQQSQVSQYPSTSGQTNTTSSSLISYPISNAPLTISNAPLNTGSSDEEETVTVSPAVLDTHIPSDNTEVDDVEIYVVLKRIRAAYGSGNFDSARDYFKNWKGILPKRGNKYYREFAEQKQRHWRVVVGWDPSNPDFMELYFNSGRSGKHYGEKDWWRYDPGQKKWVKYH